MDKKIKKRVLSEALDIIKTNATIRELAKKYKRSKSSVHHDLKIKLKEIDQNLQNQVENIFFEHIKIRHIKGGCATRLKYLKEKKDLA